jgi:hypothetical protein
MNKPTVIVVENPQEDPDVYICGDVNLIELSSYPCSKWGRHEAANYGIEYAESIKSARDLFPMNAPEWDGLNWLYTEFLKSLGEEKGEEEDGDA